MADVFSPDDTDFARASSPEIATAAADSFVQLVRLYPPETPGLAGVLMDRIGAAIHTLNCRAGWWTDLDTGVRAKRNFGELLMLIVSEIAEGAAGWENAALDDKLPDYPMLDVELADALIRVFDTSAGVGFYYSVSLSTWTADDWADVLRPRVGFAAHSMAAVGFIAAALEADRKKAKSGDAHAAAKPLAKFVLFLCAWIQSEGFRTPRAFRDKLAYNLDRLDHKPESRRNGDGPSY